MQILLQVKQIFWPHSAKHWPFSNPVLRCKAQHVKGEYRSVVEYVSHVDVINMMQ